MAAPADRSAEHTPAHRTKQQRASRTERHVRIPFDLLDDPETTPQCWAVYGALARHANRDRQCYPSLSTIVKESRTSRATVCRWLAWLEEAWYIKREQRNTRDGRTTTIYTLLTPKVLQFPRQDDTPASG